MQRMSFSFDVRCVLCTVLKVLRSEGVIDGAHAGQTRAIPNAIPKGRNRCRIKIKIQIWMYLAQQPRAA